MAWDQTRDLLSFDFHSNEATAEFPISDIFAAKIGGPSATLAFGRFATLLSYSTGSDLPHSSLTPTTRCSTCPLKSQSAQEAKAKAQGKSAKAT